MLNGETRKKRVYVDSRTFDELLTRQDRLATAILRHQNSEFLEFVRSPLETKHEELRQAPEYKLFVKDSEIEGLEIDRADFKEQMRFGYMMKDIKTVAKEIYRREPENQEELDRITTIFVQAVFNEVDKSNIYITHDKVLLDNRLWFESHFPGGPLNILSTHEASLYLDLFFKKKGGYFLTGRYRLNKGYWYWLSMRLKLPHYNVGDQMLDALSTRFYYCLMALDEIGMQYYEGANNDTQDNMLYHFNYSISLITGVFDNLALKTNSFLGIEETNLSRVSLANTSGRDFLDKIKSKDLKIWTHISSFRIFIQLIYTFRDRILHREGLDATASEYRGQDARWRANLVKLKREQVDYMKQLGDPSSKVDPLAEWGALGNLLEPYEFSQKVLAELSKFADKYLELLGEPSFVEKQKGKPDDDFTKTLMSFERFHLGF